MFTTCKHLITPWKWSGSAMGLGKLSVPVRPTKLDNSRTGPTALAVGAGAIVWTFFLSSIISVSFFLSLGNGPILTGWLFWV